MHVQEVSIFGHRVPCLLSGHNLHPFHVQNILTSPPPPLSNMVLAQSPGLHYQNQGQVWMEVLGYSLSGMFPWVQSPVN